MPKTAESFRKAPESSPLITMKPLIEMLVTTNSGWLARQLLKWTAVLTALIATHLSAKGMSADESTIIATMVASVVFGIVEFLLSFIARRYKVEGAEQLKLDIDKLRADPPTQRLLPVLALSSLCLLTLPACDTVKRLALANEPAIEAVVVYSVREGLRVGFSKLEDAPKAKQPRNVTP